MSNAVMVGARLVQRPAQDPLFRSAREALTFALNYSMQQYDRPLMNRAMSAQPDGGAEGKGLSGIDGAGQAGMIRAELGKLSPLHQAALVASIAPSQMPCECRVSCCSGWKVNPEWQEAMSELSIAAASGALSGCVSNGRLRSALIQKHFGAKTSLVELAERFGVSERTADAHSAKLKRWLFGTPAHGDNEAKPGVHTLAYLEFSGNLKAAGLLIQAG
ncbi:hypothetical protein C0J09_13935 [Bordetella avium]|uniref:hypothetical protein n=1 Tax=Bordetella avium TaxID=521 RepID=UPI000FDCB700|nr:hypothetical protein [Bordetella avium]AZY50996.1 hypothetical protein C0J09_13935 [Bordetella avium]